MAEMVKQDGNNVEFRAQVPAAEVDRAFEQMWTVIARDVRVPGFRPGKAPRKVLEQRVGSDYIAAQVSERLLEAHYPRAVRELGLNLVDAEIDPGRPQQGAAFEYVVRGVRYPKVRLGDYSAAELPQSSTDVSDEALERVMGDLQDRNATFETAERPIEAGDMVLIEEEGEEGSYPLYLDHVEAHVRDALLGKSVGDSVTISVDTEVETGSEDAEGGEEGQERAPADVTVRILEVKRKQLPALDDAFAKTLNIDSLDKLRDELRQGLSQRARSESEQQRREAFVQVLLEGLEADVPETMIARRQETMMEEIKADIARQGVKWGEYEVFMREQGKLDGFMADLRKNAEERVRRDLALEQLAEDLKVRVSDADFGRALTGLAQANRMTVQDLREQLGQNGLSGYYASLIREQALTQAIASLSADPEGEGTEGERESTATEGTEGAASGDDTAVSTDDTAVSTDDAPEDNAEGAELSEDEVQTAEAASELESGEPVTEPVSEGGTETKPE